MDWQLLKYKAGLWSVNVKQLALKGSDRMFCQSGEIAACQAVQSANLSGTGSLKKKKRF